MNLAVRFTSTHTVDTVESNERSSASPLLSGWEQDRTEHFLGLASQLATVRITEAIVPSK